MKKIFAAATLALGAVSVANAANYGTDLNLTMMPASGGMAGVGIANPLEPAAALFGNPATLANFNSGTSFSFGATFYKPEVSAQHNGGDTGTAWSADSKASDYLVPSIAVTQAISQDTVLGLGLTAISGVGSDFRGTPGSLDPLAELVLFGANAGISHRVNNNLDLGGAVTIGNGFFQAGLSSNTASRRAFGVRGTLGANYHLGLTNVGAYYRSKLSIKYKDVVNYNTNAFWDLTLEQPEEFAFGLSNASLLNGKLLLAADVIWKNWEDAKFYKDIYENQTIVALGAQLTQGKAKWRVGYSHVNGPMKSNVGSNVGEATSLAHNGTNIPLTPSLVRYLQATNAEVIWQDQVTAGFGYELTKNIQLDTHVGMALSKQETIGNTKVDAKAWQVGAGLTWKF
ncbi:MAG TPA: outer membrane protein transport protein [Thiobacillus sp.]